MTERTVRGVGSGLVRGTRFWSKNDHGVTPIQCSIHRKADRVVFMSVMCLVGTPGIAGEPLGSGGEPLRFVEEGMQRGVPFRIATNFHQVGAGNMLVDLDGDGDLDIVIAGGLGGMIGVYENDGSGHFTDRSATSGITPMPNASGLSAADYDNDGDLDIHIPGWFVPSRLYRNNGDFTFTDVAIDAQIDVVAPCLAAAWGDYNGDGWLDLYASVRTFTDNVNIDNYLFRNNKDGTFTDVATDLGVHAPGDPTCLPTFFDYDRDGDDDIYLGTDKGTTDGLMLHNKLYRNEGDGTFYNATYDAGVEAYIFCMGIAVGDINFDGYFDMYLSNIPQGNILYVNNTDGTFSDQTEPAGMQSNRIGWATVFADFDNDTHLDTYVCNTVSPNRLYRGSAVWPVVDVAPEAGVDLLNHSYCVSTGDIDGDGDLDMLVDSTDGRIRLYINHSEDASENNFVRLDIEGTRLNHNCVGAVVELDVESKTQTREVRSGTNYKSQDEFTMHFGLAKAETIKQVRLYMPGQPVRTLTNMPVNGRWTIYTPDRLGDVNNDGIISVEEVRAAVLARTGPGGMIQPGQEIFDMDGDFDIDLTDIALMGAGVFSPSQR